MQGGVILGGSVMEQSALKLIQSGGGFMNDFIQQWTTIFVDITDSSSASSARVL